ncbi:MAG: carboxypeptidase-like regulatory domain-containing protein, partial [Ignavibacteria bacterium]|nr:carboxypeptidase-like regulatory domain-containing protein [Ignavibacteria bacterium]
MIKKTVLIIFLFVANPFNIYSQLTGKITGKVIDKNNQQILSGVNISVLKDNKILKGTESEENGFFVIDNIAVGEYSLRFSLIGYTPLFKDNIFVNSGAPADVYAELEIITTDEIEVQDERFVTPSDLSNSFKNLEYEEIRRSPGGFEDIGRVVQT